MFVLVPAGDLSSQSSDTLMSLRTTPIPQVVSVGSAGVRYPAGSLGCVVVQCASRAWRTGAGECCRILVYCLVVRRFSCGEGEGCRLFGLLLGGWKFRLVRRVFRKRPQGVTRTLSAAKRGRAERPGDGCPCVGAEETCGVAAMLHGGLVLIAYQSTTPVRASSKTAVN